MKSSTEVDRDKAIPMLRRAVELGINYFDTAVMYCAGDSQRVLGEAMEDIRDQVILSTKNHHYDKHDVAGWWKNLEDSLKFLRTDYIDVYNVHGLNYEGFERCFAGEDGLYKQLVKAKEQGLIRHICHSFHGSLESMKKMVDTGLFEAITCQYNLLDRHLEEGIAYAAEHGEGVVIMGPVGGGRLGYPSERVRELVGDVKSTPELALRFVLSNPNVTLALSGMQNMQMLEENVETVSRAGKLTEEDHAAIEAAIQERKELLGLYCTGCGYCMPCPEGVDIPTNFEILNLERVFGLSEHARSRYAGLDGKAALCRLCGKCLKTCPQELDIPGRLSEAVSVLDARAGSVGGWSELRGASAAGDGLLSVKLRWYMKNFTDSDREVRVRLHPHREEQVKPASFGFRALRAYGRRHRDLELLVRPPLETLSIDLELEQDGEIKLDHIHYVVTEAWRAEGYRFRPGSRRSGTLHVPSPLHPVHGSGQRVEGHSFDFVASYDDDDLYVYADVEDDLARAAAEGEGDARKADGLWVFLDGRVGPRLGRSRYDEGVMSLAICPRADARAAPLVWTSNGAEVRAKSARTPSGYRVECAIPWSAFSHAKGVPAVIGFDIGIVSHDAEGKEALRLSWTGRSGQEKDPRTFGRLLPVA